MEGIGLDNMLGAEEVEKLFSNQAEVAEETASQQEEEKTPNPNENSETEETAEVDFSDLFGNQPESVGSGKHTEGNRETPESKDDSGTPQTNLFASIAKALKDEGVFPDLSDDALKEVTDAASLKKMFEDEATKSLDDVQKKIAKAINGGATSEELQTYQQALGYSQFLDRKETYDLIIKEGEDGNDLRKRVMYQDYVNRGFEPERAEKMVMRSFDDGTDIDDAKVALESCKKFYKDQVDDYQQELENRQQQQRAAEEKQYANLKKHILDKESFYDGVKVDKSIRQKAYDSITKPIYRDEDGNYMTAMQKYQRENPIEFMENVALLFALTDNFKSVEKLAKDKVKAKVKSSFEEIANVLNNSKRNGDGTLNLANTAPDDSEREKWELAI
jgi:hypothetical protein